VNRTLGELSALVAKVSDIYAERNGIARDDDWYALKLQEELGELIAEYLRGSQRGRLKGADAAAVRLSLEDETADVLAMILLFARQHRIDLDGALQRKWFKHLPQA